jgi:photoactive yellow protein
MLPSLAYDQMPILEPLHALDDAALDALDFGVIAFDAAHRVRRYNAREAGLSGLKPSAVIGLPLFTDVAQCMNNYLVAQRFDDAAAVQMPLDLTIDFVLTWRMRPTPVQLRLLSAPDIDLQYLLLLRHTL